MAKSRGKATDDAEVQQQQPPPPPPQPQERKPRRKKREGAQGQEARSSAQDAAAADSLVQSNAQGVEMGNLNSKPAKTNKRDRNEKAQDEEAGSSGKDTTSAEDSSVQSNARAAELENLKAKPAKRNKKDMKSLNDVVEGEERKVKRNKRDKVSKATSNVGLVEGDEPQNKGRKKMKMSHEETSKAQERNKKDMKSLNDVVEGKERKVKRNKRDKVSKATSNVGLVEGDEPQNKGRKKMKMSHEETSKAQEEQLLPQLKGSLEGEGCREDQPAVLEGEGTTKSENQESTNTVVAMGMGTQTVQAQSKTLFVGNIPHPTRVDQLIGFFAKAGLEVVDCMVPYYNGCSRGFGYVEFSSAEDALKATESLHKTELMGQPVTLEFAYEDVCNKRKNYMSGNWGMRRSIVVKGLDESVEEKDVQGSLTKHFAECEILHIRVPGHQDSVTGIYKNEGKAILNMKDHDSFMRAQELDKSNLNGKRLDVTEAKAPVRGPCFLCVYCGGGGITCAKCGAPIGGKLPVTASTNVSQSSQKATVFTVVVKNLDSALSQEETENYLMGHFSSYGPVAKVSVPLVPGSKVIRSIAFIDFGDQESATRALITKHPWVNGRRLLVESKRL